MATFRMFEYLDNRQYLDNFWGRCFRKARRVKNGLFIKKKVQFFTIQNICANLYQRHAFIKIIREPKSLMLHQGKGFGCKPTLINS